MDTLNFCFMVCSSMESPVSGINIWTLVFRYPRWEAAYCSGYSIQGAAYDIISSFLSVVSTISWMHKMREYDIPIPQMLFRLVSLVLYAAMIYFWWRCHGFSGPSRNTGVFWFAMWMINNVPFLPPKTPYPPVSEMQILIKEFLFGMSALVPVGLAYVLRQPFKSVAFSHSIWVICSVPSIINFWRVCLSLSLCRQLKVAMCLIFNELFVAVFSYTGVYVPKGSTGISGFGVSLFATFLVIWVCPLLLYYCMEARARIVFLKALPLDYHVSDTISSAYSHRLNAVKGVYAMLVVLWWLIVKVV